MTTQHEVSPDPNTVIKKSLRVIHSVICYEITEDELVSLEDNVGESSVALTFAATFFGATLSLLGGVLTIPSDDHFHRWLVFLLLFVICSIATIWFSIVAYRRWTRMHRVLAQLRESSASEEIADPVEQH